MDNRSSERHKMSSSEKALYKYKIITTIFYFYAWFNLGIMHCVLSSTLPDFRNRIGITNEEFGRMAFITTFIQTAGAFLCGVFADHFQKHILLIVALNQLAMALSHVLIPWSVNIYMAGFLFTIRDTAFGSLNAIGGAYIVSMWGKKSSMWIHLLHAGYPLGCVFGPIITGPFLSEKESCEHTNNITLHGYNISDTLIQNTTAVPPTDGLCVVVEDKIEWPFAIGAISWIVSTILFLLLHFDVIKQPEGFKLNREPTKKFRDSCNPKTCAPGRPWFGVQMVIIFFIYYSCLASVNIITSMFVFTYAVEGPFQFSNQEADYLDIALKGSMLLGRFFILPIACFIPIHKLLLVELLLLFMCSVLLATLGTAKAIYLWIFSCLFNFIMAPLWPAGLSWFDRYVTLYTAIITASDIFVQTAVATTVWLVGYILDGDNQHYMWRLDACLCGLLLLATCLGQSLTCCNGERKFLESTNQNKEDDDVSIPLRNGSFESASEEF